MGYEQQGSRKIAEKILKPFDGRDIKIVRRFVQQEDVRILQQQFHQQHLVALAAGQVRHVAVEADFPDAGPGIRGELPPKIRKGVRAKFSAVREVPRMKPEKRDVAFAGGGVERRGEKGAAFAAHGVAVRVRHDTLPWPGDMFSPRSASAGSADDGSCIHPFENPKSAAASVTDEYSSSETFLSKGGVSSAR